MASAALVLAPLLGVSSACLDRPIGSPEPVTTNILVDKITQTSVDKIDLLFMIDNSISMSDKQDILRLAVPDLVSRLVNPICVDSAGVQRDPPVPGQQCPAGQTQEFNPINDINIGVVSSSLGDFGANVACPQEGAPDYRADRVDMAHLIGSLERSRVQGDTPEGFLAWRAGSTDLADFNEDFQQMVRDVGELGCGWEASLESWYRFLVDPFPYRELVRVQCPGSTSTGPNCVQPATENDLVVLDDTLLAQREAFLRPDSLVAIIMLSDENDCSIQVGNQTWVVTAINDARPMFRGSSRCAEDPNDKCCYSCPLGPPEGCAADPICEEDPDNQVLENRLPQNEDGLNLRCYQQKRRFGVDFLYPTQRYVNALTQFELCWNATDLSLEGCPDDNRVDNPLYAGGRPRELVFLGGIVGVPWQAIASPNDASGLPLTDPAQLRFKDYDEMNAPGDTTWEQILGSPGVAWRPAGGGRPEVAGVPALPPEMPQMIETEFPRVYAGANGNEINGWEYDTSQGQVSRGAPDDLQYACIFPLDPPRDCADRDSSRDACDCYEGDNDRPLCEPDPANPDNMASTVGSVQYFAKAYPGGRHLQVLKDYGANSIVASICARNVADPERPDFGYRPAIAAIVDRLKEQLGDRCLPRPLLIDSEDRTVACNLVETIPQPDGPCSCNAATARRAPEAGVDSVVRGRLAQDPARPCGDADPSCAGACLCEVLQVQQVEGPNPEQALEICQNNEDAAGVEGWCYIDAEQGIGNEALVENCPATQRRLLRFVGSGLAPNTTTFVACTGESFSAGD